ncbi:MAG: hypothetical protein JSS20_15960 [Proteobacteria bacterium]|nr:hypothetical protein [Pseudomonadota bacterium]
MTAKDTIVGRLSARRGLDEADAAAHLALCPAKFCQLVAEGIAPRPRSAEQGLVWDIDALERARPAMLIANLGLRNIDRFVDRHGKTRCYYRSGRGPRVRLPGMPGSPEFMSAYEAAAGSGSDKRAQSA